MNRWINYIRKQGDYAGQICPATYDYLVKTYNIEKVAFNFLRIIPLHNFLNPRVNLSPGV
jgi:hypothetical protein